MALAMIYPQSSTYLLRVYARYNFLMNLLVASMLPLWDVTWATWALVVVGVVGTVAALLTLGTINDQTKAVRASTDALINSERAWIVVEVEPLAGLGGIHEGEELIHDIITRTTSYTVTITCRNDGKTTAWITEKRVCIDVVDSLPAMPNWESVDIIDTEPEPVSAKVSTSKEASLQCEKARDFGAMVVIYGLIRYRDFFAPERSTSFAYKVRIDGELERLAGYSKYNENT
jgi:hypothetical protein